MNTKFLYQGAEAIITLNAKDSKVIKNRIKKSYRIPEIDEKLRKFRTRNEVRILERLKEVIKVPKLISFNEKNKEISMEFIKGKKLSEFLEKLDYKTLCFKIGELIAKMHDKNIIHGDLTTSNMILSDNDKEVYFIDFGLAFHSKRVEDKAVDLHLFKQALETKHFTICEECFNRTIQGYNPLEKESILKQLKKVESRGRYKKGS